MAVAVLATPRSPAQKKCSFGHNLCSKRVCTIEDGPSFAPLSEHENVADGVAAGPFSGTQAYMAYLHLGRFFGSLAHFGTENDPRNVYRNVLETAVL
jgi:hypothetical protein